MQKALQKRDARNRAARRQPLREPLREGALREIWRSREWRRAGRCSHHGPILPVLRPHLRADRRIEGRNARLRYRRPKRAALQLRQTAAD